MRADRRLQPQELCRLHVDEEHAVLDPVAVGAERLGDPVPSCVAADVVGDDVAVYLEAYSQA